jgi:hypothetical protein
MHIEAIYLDDNRAVLTRGHTVLTVQGLPNHQRRAGDGPKPLFRNFLPEDGANPHKVRALLDPSLDRLGAILG